MTNKSLFATRTGTSAVATTRNAAGGKAFEFTPKHALAQITATNCFNGTYYVSAGDNLKIAKDAALAMKEDPVFLAQTAVYGRSKSYMKDMPAFLCVVLADVCQGLPKSDPRRTLFASTFAKVIDNGKMLRNFIQMARSGAVTDRPLNCGAESGLIRHAMNKWFRDRSARSLFKASIGNDPTMRDILRMCRPKPESEEKATLYAYFNGAELDPKTGKFRTYRWKDPAKKHEGGLVLAYEHDWENLPQCVREYEAFKRSREGRVPNVDFRMLDSLGLSSDEWKQVAYNAPWMMTRMNLNTFKRHGVFEDKELTQRIADRLRDREEIGKARAFPHQLYQAYRSTEGVPGEVEQALHDAIDIALENVPAISGKVFVCVDVSGSMGCGLTGFRRGATTVVRCVDQAALFASALLRKNPQVEIMPFDTSVHKCRLNPRDTVFTNADKLAQYGGGGTDCSLPLKEINHRREKANAVIYISDYESWVDSAYFYYRGSTGMLTEWEKFHEQNPEASLVCMDLTPRPNAQVKKRPNILQVGGFGDQVFDVVASFIESGSQGADYWVSQIEETEV